MKASASSLFCTLFPSNCRLCGSALTNFSRLPVCLECLHAIEPIQEEGCEICGERLFSFVAKDAKSPHTAPEPMICGMCKRARPLFERAVAYGSYDGNLRELLHLLKYNDVRPAASFLSKFLATAIAKLGPIEDEWLLVPVPLHRSKHWQRGFNQAEVLAAGASRTIPSLRLETSILKRRRPTESQTGLTRHQRRANIRGAFEVHSASRISGKNILLVDDVFTTGTTAAECTRVLLRAGAKKVSVATVARVLKGEGQGANLRITERTSFAVSGG